MKLFVDSADPAEIGACVAAERTSGATTSAAALAGGGASAGREARELLAAICAVANGPVSVEVAAGDRDEMLREARDWAAVAAGVVVQLPATDAGLEVVRACAAERIRTGVAPCATPEQALRGRARGRGLRLRRRWAGSGASTATT